MSEYGWHELQSNMSHAQHDASDAEGGVLNKNVPLNAECRLEAPMRLLGPKEVRCEMEYISSTAHSHAEFA